MFFFPHLLSQVQMHILLKRHMNSRELWSSTTMECLLLFISANLWSSLRLITEGPVIESVWFFFAWNPLAQLFICSGRSLLVETLLQTILNAVSFHFPYTSWKATGLNIRKSPDILQRLSSCELWEIIKASDLHRNPSIFYICSFHICTHTAYTQTTDTHNTTQVSHHITNM